MIHRTGDTDITDNLSLLIQLCEAELHDEMMMRELETESSLTLTTNVNYVALPTGYVSPVALWLVIDSERTELERTLPEFLPYSSTAAQPEKYAIDGENIRFDCPAYEGYTGKFRHKVTDALSDSNTTNQLLLKRPDVYLWGTLKQVAILTSDDALLQKSVPLYEAAKRATKAAESRNRSVPLRTDMAVPRSNIFAG